MAGAVRDAGVAERAKRGDFRLDKVADASQVRLAGVAFPATSETTGEAHVTATDENGSQKLQTSEDLPDQCNTKSVFAYKL